MPIPAGPPSSDLSTDLGVVRLLITDLDVSAYLLTDAQITAFLTLEGTVRLAAAAALETIATSEVLISKKIRTQDLSTDGPAVAKELRERAAALRKQAADAGEGSDAAYLGFDIVDFDPSYGDNGELVT
jgi:hypothetical protein